MKIMLKTVVFALVTAADGTSQAYTVTVKAQFLESGSNAAADETALRALISAAQDGDTLVISGDFDVAAGVSGSTDESIIIEKAITIVSPPGETLTFNLKQSDDKMFFLNTGGTLTLGGPGSGDIVLDGGAVWGGGSDGTPAGGATNTGPAHEPFIEINGGTFIMYDGVTLKNNSATTNLYVMGGAIQLLAGEVIINGGIIENCKANKFGDSAGAIHMMAPALARLTINGGIIRGNRGGGDGNTAGSIKIGGNATFEWVGGTITNNWPNDNNYGSINVSTVDPPTLILHGHTAASAD
jgi:hypothetical protein